MLIVAMIIGPVIGLLVADFIERYRAAGLGNWLVTWGVLILFLVFVAFATFFSAEVRIGLFFGTLLGVLIGMTPIPRRTPERPG